MQFTGRRKPILISGAGKVVDGILRRRPCFLSPCIDFFHLRGRTELSFSQPRPQQDGRGISSRANIAFPGELAADLDRTQTPAVARVDALLHDVAAVVVASVLIVVIIVIVVAVRSAADKEERPPVESVMESAVESTMEAA